MKKSVLKNPLRSPMRSSIKKPKAVQQEEKMKETISFEESVSRLLEFMYLGADNFTFSNIKLDDASEIETPHKFNSMPCTEQLNNFNEDVKTSNQQKEDDNKKKVALVNGMLTTEQKHTRESIRRSNTTIKDPNTVIDQLNASLQSKHISERIQKAHADKQRVHEEKNKQKQEPVAYYRTIADKQRLFNEREKFRQNYRNENH